MIWAASSKIHLNCSKKYPPVSVFLNIPPRSRRQENEMRRLSLPNSAAISLAAEGHLARFRRYGSSAAVRIKIHIGYVKLAAYAHRAEDFGHGGARPAAVARDHFFDVGPRLGA